MACYLVRIGKLPPAIHYVLYEKDMQEKKCKSYNCLHDHSDRMLLLLPVLDRGKGLHTNGKLSWPYKGNGARGFRIDNVRTFYNNDIDFNCFSHIVHQITRASPKTQCIFNDKRRSSETGDTHGICSDSDIYSFKPSCTCLAYSINTHACDGWNPAFQNEICFTGHFAVNILPVTSD
ncbi:hypothetical protein DPMN_133385 [Dreissena polymorpha]|uniref:Uncharacterized protein n=1 Tax=Dreissena polymorpha TaxID=45954 RepID=A0A9D4FU82_DREPO|nr:hypothetical protein DPMN_133385 [Dreissena polymorpha]